VLWGCVSVSEWSEICECEGSVQVCARAHIGLCEPPGVESVPGSLVERIDLKCELPVRPLAAIGLLRYPQARTRITPAHGGPRRHAESLRKKSVCCKNCNIKS
jgi:hypothetical protein